VLRAREPARFAARIITQKKKGLKKRVLFWHRRGDFVELAG